MIKPYLGLFISSALLFTPCQNLGASAVPENALKAAYLIHLSEFTTWPDEKMRLPYFNICLASGSSLAAPLTEIKGDMVKQRQLNILYDVSAEQLNECHVFYVEDEFNKKTFQESLSKHNPILTVSSNADFAKAGGIIEYYRDGERIKMRVNLKVLKQSTLTISSKLLRLMEISF